MLVGAIALGIQRLLRSPLAGLVSSSAAESFFPGAIEFAALMLLYRFLPNAVVGWSAAAVAAGVVAILLETLRGLLGFYVRALSRVNLITGSLTLVLLTLLSLFLVWVLILMGVELTHVLQTRAAQRRLSGRQRAGRAENAIRMLLALARNEARGLTDLYRMQEGSSHEAQQILECLREKGLVSGDGARGFSLAREPETITLSEVVEAVSPNLYTVSPDEEDRVVLVLEPLFHRLDAERRALLGATLADLIET